MKHHVAHPGPLAADPGLDRRGRLRLVRRFRRHWKHAVVGSMGILAFLLVAAWIVLPLVPLPHTLLKPPASHVEIVDRHGRTLREVRHGDNAFGRRVAYSEIPQPLIHATLAAEDRRFWQHPGVDGRAVARAVWSLARHRRVVSGGSTVTMQLVKISSTPRPRNLRTKLIESARALRLEQVWDKQRILTEYLNRLDYGNFNVGCATAAEFYFGKPLQDLSAAECALLAGLPQAPTRLNPHDHLERARKRQQWILERMRTCGFLTQDEFQRAAAEPLRLASPRRAFKAPHLVDLLVRQIGETGAFPNPLPDRLRTTVDLDLNLFVERVLRQRLSQLQAQQVQNAAAVVIDNRTGDVLALVGSEDYFGPEAGQVNGAWAARSAGSTFKPFTYLLAFERGANPATVVADVPTEFPTTTGLFAPVNYNRRCYGPMRYRLALANSLNISAVKVLASIGGAEVLQERLQACGLTTLTQPADFYGLGLTIGNAEARLVELANAYACLARLGEFKPYRLTMNVSAAGHRRQTEPARLFDAGAAYLIADILSDNAARTLAFGAESSLRFSFPVACKTGTSSDFRDNWALGFTPEFTVGVWVGNFDGSPMNHTSGVTGAAPILHDVFEHLHGRYGTSWYAPPPGVVKKPVHPLTGKLLTSARISISRQAPVFEKLLEGSLPRPESPDDYDSAGRVSLEPGYRDWFDSSDNWLADHAVLRRSAPALRILSPLPGTVFYLDPDLPESSRRILLQAEGADDLTWQSDSLECRAESGAGMALLTEGRHRLQVRERHSGTRQETWIVVKAL